MICTISGCLCGYDVRSDYSSLNTGTALSHGPSGGGDVTSNKRYESGKVVHAALHSKYNVRYVNVDIPTEEREPQIIEVDASPLPIIMNFRSASSQIRVQQSHSGVDTGQVQETKSEEQPTLLVHQVNKPIIQEVREIITPYRRVIQEIRPIEEEIHTIVARKLDKRVESGKESISDVSFGGKARVEAGVAGSSGWKPHPQQQQQHQQKRYSRGIQPVTLFGSNNYVRYI